VRPIYARRTDKHGKLKDARQLFYNSTGTRD